MPARAVAQRRPPAPPATGCGEGLPVTGPQSGPPLLSQESRGFNFAHSVCGHLGYFGRQRCAGVRSGHGAGQES